VITRREMIVTAAGAAAAAMTGAVRSVLGQGISSRGVRAQPRGKPSGKPFLAQLSDVGAKAGLTHPVVYGGVDSKSYIIEVVGCGIAFLDYDNDGWLDIVALNGTRLEDDPPGATNRLQEQSLWHVHRCDCKSWTETERMGLRYNCRRLR